MQTKFRFSRLKIILIGAALLATIGAVMLMKDLQNEQTTHQATVTDFLTARHYNHLLNETVLRSRTFLTDDYDSLVSISGDLSLYCTEGPTPTNPNGTFDAGRWPDVMNAREKFCEALRKKLDSVERFKSANSILKNALHYLPELIAQTRDPVIRSVSTSGFNLLLRYAADPMSSEIRDEFESFLRQTRPDRRSVLQAEAAMHLQTGAKALQARGAAEADVFHPRVEDAILKLQSTYFRHDNERAQGSSRGRAFLVLACAFLGLITVGTFLKIHRDSLLLADLNLDLESKVKVILAECDRAEKANLAKSVFLANMSHELRTPMHGILSFARFGQQKIETATKERLKSYFDEIYESGFRLMALLNDVLDLSKLESGKIEYSPKANDLSETVRLVTSEMCAFSTEMGLRVEMLTHLPVFASFDNMRIMQVVRNILSNAIKFSERGSVVEIKIEKIANGTASCRVTNRGVGIPDSELESIFEKFIQSSKTKSGAGGTGLGLAICREIIHQHGGKIWAESGPTGETHFTFELPETPVESHRKAA